MLIKEDTIQITGPNNTVHVYPIQREGLWATKDSFFRGIDIPGWKSFLNFTFYALCV
jgi:hypothetical protein